MQKIDKIIYNLALINLNDFCKSQGLDISGTHLEKTPRKYVYTLLRINTHSPLASVEFKPNSIPSHLVYTTH